MDFQEEFEINCREYLENYVPFDDEQKIFVSGGFFPRFAHNLRIRDIDVYVNDPELFIAVKKCYLSTGFEEIYDSGNHLFSKLQHHNSSVPDIDLIGFHVSEERFKDRGYDYVSEFDFTICQATINSKCMKLNYYNPNTSTDIMGKRLRINRNFVPKVKSHYSANNVISRISKYRDLGFEMADDEYNYLYGCLMSYEMPKKDALLR